MPQVAAPIFVGRYALYNELAAGGMGAVHIGRLGGAAGFARTVAVKRLHPQLARDAEFSAMLLDEARIAARLHHPNVVPTLDVVAQDGELFVVMEYVAGETLLGLVRAHAPGAPIPLSATVAILSGVLAGLHAAHEAKDERGEPLLIVHRDISPQNVLVGQDGVPRVLDFGIAKAMGRYQQTGRGVIKGKLGYMPPEQVRGEAIDRRADVYAAGVVLWEALTSKRLFRTDSDWATVQRIFAGVLEPPSLYRPEVPQALDDIVMRACHVDPAGRFSSAEEFAAALDDLGLGATPRELRDLVLAVAKSRLDDRAALVSAIEKASLSEQPPAEIPGAPRAALPDRTAADEHVAATSGGEPTSVATPNPVERSPVESASRSKPRRARTLTAAIAGGVLVIGLAVRFVWSARTPTQPPLAASPPVASESAHQPTAPTPDPPTASSTVPTAVTSALAPSAPAPSASSAAPRTPATRSHSRGVFDSRH